MQKSEQVNYEIERKRFTLTRCVSRVAINRRIRLYERFIAQGTHTAKLPWIDIIIFNTIRWSDHFHVLQARDCPHHGFLNVFW